MPDSKFVLLVWEPNLVQKACGPMSLEDAFYMQVDLVEGGLTNYGNSRIVEVTSPERLRELIAKG